MAIPKDIQANLKHVQGIKDRSSPLVFVGRHEEMKFLRQVVDLVRNIPVGPDQPEGTLRLIHGVPGAGKSALKKEFARRMMDPPPLLDLQADGKADEGGPPQAPPPPSILCVELTTAHLALPPLHLVRSITKNVVKSQARWQLAQFPKTQIDAKVVWNAVSRWLMRGASWDTVRDSSHGLAEVSPLADCLDTYADSVWPPGITIVLVIDEVQNLKTDNENTKNNMQCLFAGGRGVRMPTICFGLSNSGEVLDKTGISRSADESDLSIGQLNPGEGRHIIVETMRKIGLTTAHEGWCDHLRSIGMSESGWRDWSSRLADRLALNAAEFPQHVAVAHTALCDNLLKTGGPCTIESLDQISQNHLKRKREYYQKRLGSENIKSHKVALGAIGTLFDRAGGSPVRWTDALSLLKMGNDHGKALTDEEAEQVLQAAINKGVFSEAPGEAATKLQPPPIPSMQHHLVTLFDKEAQDNPTQSLLNMRAFLGKPAPARNAADDPAAEDVAAEDGCLEP